MKNKMFFAGLSLLQVVAAVMYAVAFPLSQLLGGSMLTFCLFLTAPFLAVGYIVGMIFVAVFRTEAAYPFGLFFAVLAQVWYLLAYWNRKRNNPTVKTDA